MAQKLWQPLAVDRKVTLWSLNLIHKFNPNYLLIKLTTTICFHAMRPSKYQNNNTESLMGVQTSYMLIFRKTGRHLFLQCFKFGKAMYIIRNKIRVICSKIRVGMGGSIFPRGGSIFHRGIWTPGSIFPYWILTPGPYSGGGGHIQYDTCLDRVV